MESKDTKKCARVGEGRVFYPSHAKVRGPEDAKYTYIEYKLLTPLDEKLSEILLLVPWGPYKKWIIIEEEKISYSKRKKEHIFWNFVSGDFFGKNLQYNLLY